MTRLPLNIPMFVIWVGEGDRKGKIMKSKEISVHMAGTLIEFIAWKNKNKNYPIHQEQYLRQNVIPFNCCFTLSSTQAKLTQALELLIIFCK